MEKRMKLAGIPVEIHTLYDLPACTREYETDEPPVFTVRITEQDIVDERKKSISEAAYEGIAYPTYSPAELESTAVYRKIAMRLPEYDAFVFHGAAVAVGDRAFVFTAGSGTGKTTHTALWIKNIAGSFVINGDKPILRIMDGKPFVCGTPWMGKESMGCNKIVPLSAICYLNRGTVNRIEEADLEKLCPRLIGQAYRPPDRALVAQTVRLLERIGRSVPLYELFCNMEDEAADIAFRGMC